MFPHPKPRFPTGVPQDCWGRWWWTKEAFALKTITKIIEITSNPIGKIYISTIWEYGALQNFYQANSYHVGTLANLYQNLG